MQKNKINSAVAASKANKKKSKSKLYLEKIGWRIKILLYTLRNTANTTRSNGDRYSNDLPKCAVVLV